MDISTKTSSTLTTTETNVSTQTQRNTKSDVSFSDEMNKFANESIQPETTESSENNKTQASDKSNKNEINIISHNKNIDNVKTEINGITHTLSEWSEITGVNINTLQDRYYKGDRGERLIRKAISSNTGITGISKTKEGKFQVDVFHKKKRYRAKTKTLEEAIKKKEEILNSIKNKER